MSVPHLKTPSVSPAAARPVGRACDVMLPCPVGLIGYDMAVKAAREAYEQAGVEPGDVDVVELHDCFSTNELITYEALVMS